MYWDDYERIDGRWYFRRRLPLYWYASNLSAPPIGENKMRWPYEGHGTSSGPLTRSFGRPAWTSPPMWPSRRRWESS